MTVPDTALPADRLRVANAAPPRRRGDFVLYWMIAQRRLAANHALDRALEWARALARPLLVLEAVRAGYRHASDRHHRFLLEGMQDNARAAAGAPLTYHAFVEPAADAGKGLLAALGRHACVVVTDEFPGFFLPRMVAAAAAALPVRLEVVDSCGVLPLRRAEREFTVAHSFRRHLQREFGRAFAEAPRARPLAGLALPVLADLPPPLRRRYPAADLADLDALLAALPIDHGVRPVAGRCGGSRAGRRALGRFVRDGLDRYHEDHNHPDRAGTSGLSPYLHYGHVGAHEAVARVLAHADWRPGDLPPRADGRRAGLLGVRGDGVAAFLDQLLTWRELGLGFAWHRADHTRWSSLPEWAQASLDRHAEDPRDPCYTRREFERAATHDELWNAAQRELLEDGIIHNAMRMLWGKKILEWSPSPRQALRTLFHLNDRYALDGRDPNSATGILWTLGRHDRPWGPRRPVFGTVRYLSSDQSRRKWQLTEYLARHGGQAGSVSRGGGA